MRIFKYKPFNWYALKWLVQDELYLAHAESELNDPVDCALIVEGQSVPLAARVCALSKNHTSPLMWSQYAGGHKGVCFELDYPAIETAVKKKNKELAESFTFGPVKYLDPVSYRNEIKKRTTLITAGNYIADYRKMVMLKTNSFEHEEEVRIVSKSINLLSILKVPGLVKGVYVGIKMSKSDRDFLKTLVGMVCRTSGREVEAYAAVALTDKFRLQFRPLDWGD